MSEIKYYIEKETAENILNNKNEYLTTQFFECSEEALNKKYKMFLEWQKTDWKLLMLEYKDILHIYELTIYLKK